MRALLKHPLFDCDLEEAALWYHQRTPGIEEHLIDETESSMRAIAANPFHFPPCYRFYRRVKIQRFPYNLYFQIKDNAVIALALIHTSRDVHSILVSRLSQEEN